VTIISEQPVRDADLELAEASSELTHPAAGFDFAMLRASRRDQRPSLFRTYLLFPLPRQETPFGLGIFFSTQSAITSNTSLDFLPSIIM
jgi:hypothetical protein